MSRRSKRTASAPRIARRPANAWGILARVMTRWSRPLLIVAASVSAVAGCGSTAVPTPAPSPAAPTASATATPAPTPSTAITPVALATARDAVLTLLSGTPGVSGSPCFVNGGMSAADYSGCPVTDRLAARLPQGCGWQEFLYGNGSSQHLTVVGDPLATAGGATVSINTDPPNGGFTTDAVVLDSSGRWLVDDLVRRDQAPQSIYTTPTQPTAC